MSFGVIEAPLAYVAVVATLLASQPKNEYPLFNIVPSVAKLIAEAGVVCETVVALGAPDDAPLTLNVTV